ncbi:MAG: family 16 glycosylhydrolase [Opitutales bacterium]|jgi:beta-glucanase (GH16 family)|nr:family 16 glycosylhydrolase [Opitutales bacterium]MDP4778072.1 family 16 glycosylhydrolase [Opitutales bacterium]MDP4883417.1 family 16 glycosylhydrolase [Opitutales bacterium]MDP5079701.1 family 16 glycosylhydrolase [Opitutales bacterium]
MRYRNLLLSLSLCMSIAHAELPTKGLVLHLDSSVKESIELDSTGHVLCWNDLSGKDNHATAEADYAPIYAMQALHGEPAIRFSGKQRLNLPVLSQKINGYSIFIVFQRTAEQATDHSWQRLISSTTEEFPEDNKEPGIQLNTAEDAGAMEARIIYDLFRSDLRATMTIGSKHLYHQQHLYGDIAEVLVYDRSFIVFEPIEAIGHYLQEKWNLKVPTEGDWTRNGALPEPLPVRQTDALPLSDQANQGQWQPFTPMWDEFNENSLDTDKWHDHNPYWYGRIPGRFLARHVRVENGKMAITMVKDSSLPHEQFYRSHNVYKDYASGSIVSKERINYGYFEIRAKPMASAGSSAWWFTGSSIDQATDTHIRLEIDVFEIGGKAKGKELKYNMNLHDFKTAANPKHYSLGGSWVAERPLAGDFRVYGLEWTPETIKYFVDGVLVRRVNNTRWHGPQYMVFDSETMFDWLGVPEESDLPSTFEVDYVRAWTNPETANNWRERYTPIERSNGSRITDYVRSMDP